jgi:hypothetical protein
LRKYLANVKTDCSNLAREVPFVQMPRPVTPDLARRRRDRLSELIDALGVARGLRVTQRDFAASIGREQGTIAAILGGHRALGGDVMMAVIQAYRLSMDFFDGPLRPDPRPYARAAVSNGALGTAVLRNPSPAISSPQPAIVPQNRVVVRETAVSSGDPVLAEVITTYQPDRAVVMALEALARRGVRGDSRVWLRLCLGAQSAHDHGVLVDWFDQTSGQAQPRQEMAFSEHDDQSSEA